MLEALAAMTALPLSATFHPADATNSRPGRKTKKTQEEEIYFKVRGIKW